MLLTAPGLILMTVARAVSLPAQIFRLRGVLRVKVNLFPCADRFAARNERNNNKIPRNTDMVTPNIRNP
jgi:hypothetical protein